MDPIEAHQDAAPDYDQQAHDWGWYPEIFLGLMWDYIQPGQTLLEAAIGTGLCSEPFHRAGLAIAGFDGSDNMLDICRKKGFTTNLKNHNILTFPWPYDDRSFDHILVAGVFHFFGDLEAIFAEVSRIIKPDGVFGLVVSRLAAEEIERQRLDAQTGFAQVPDEASGVNIYKHSDGYIRDLLTTCGFISLKELVFVGSLNPQTGAEHWAKATIARKQ